MKKLYVALTRPEHLLCLAMDKSDFPSSLVSVREYAGWKIRDLTLGEKVRNFQIGSELARFI